MECLNPALALTVRALSNRHEATRLWNALPSQPAANRFP